MKNLEPNLTFNGECEKAFTFYESVFEAKIAALIRYKDIPAEAKKDVAEADMERVIHALLHINDKIAIMGADAPSSMKVQVGENVSLTLNVSSETEARNIFDKLSADGKVTVGLGKTFFADLYAMFTDKFGINWMILYIKEK